LHGYQKSFKIGETGGLLAYGGQHGTAFVSLPGSACALIQDWYSVYHLFHEIYQGRITRWDGAVDMFEGVPSVDDAVRFYFYQEGEFSTGGNKPKFRQIGNWMEMDGSGRTVYIGARRSGKMLRVYEKGKQLGDPSSPWVRWELELHNRDRIIPWEVILEPGCFLAASYTCMGWINEKKTPVETLQKTGRICYERLIHYARQAYGPLINVMIKVEGSPKKVVERLQRPGVPARLELGGLSLAEYINESSDGQDD
jgi:phage replication initiation protein